MLEISKLFYVNKIKNQTKRYESIYWACKRIYYQLTGNLCTKDFSCDHCFVSYSKDD
jgi:hypothetical protein